MQLYLHQDLSNSLLSHTRAASPLCDVCRQSLKSVITSPAAHDRMCDMWPGLEPLSWWNGGMVTRAKPGLELQAEQELQWWGREGGHHGVAGG